MGFHKSLLSSLLSLASLQTISALPTIQNAVQSYPEVIPGPGLPSLESLNLTSAQLYEMPLPKPNSIPHLQARAQEGCGPTEEYYTNVNDVIACFNYLNNLGTIMCGVPPGSGATQMCRSGRAQVVAYSETTRSESSYCRDVASGVLWVVNHCTRPDQSVAGFAPPYGNGNMVVHAMGW